MTKNNITKEYDLYGDPILFRTNDEFGDILVIERSPYRVLTFDSNFDQSSIDLRNPLILVHEYTRAMMLALAFIKPRHAVILGLGGGCLLRSLHNLLPQCEVHAIELRQRVYEVASEFFGIPVNKNINITISDAEYQLNNINAASTDIIFADMFSAYCMNPLQMQQNFVTQCHRVLSKKGWLVINYHDIPDLNTTFFKFMCSIFTDVFIYKTVANNNHVVFASKEPINALHDFKYSIAELERKLGSKSINFFNRLIRLNSVGRFRKST